MITSGKTLYRPARREDAAAVAELDVAVAAVRAELMDARARLAVAEAFEAEAKANIARLEDGWRAAQSLLDSVDAELDAALAEE